MYYDEAMAEVPIRMLNQETARVLARVKQGEEIDITERGVVVLEAALVAAQPLGQLVGRSIEGMIRALGLRIALQEDVAANMDRQVAPDQMGVAGKDDIRLDRVVEVLRGRAGEGVADMGAQCVTDVDLLASNGQLHGCRFTAAR